MHFYSFDMKDPVFDLGMAHLSVQVITLENIYGLDPSRCQVTDEGGVWRVRCDQLRWAGGQHTAPGEVELVVQRESPDRLRVSVHASAPHKIRAVKVLLRDLPPLQYLDLLDRLQSVPGDGVIMRYPNQFQIPLLIATDGARTIGVRAEDPQARAKRFALYAERMGPLAGRWTLELIHEEDARYFAPSLDTPDWIVARGVTPDAFRAEQLAYSEAALGLVPWERRVDVPDWARDLRLCLTLHGMHWSGYTFNTYEDMRRIVDFACERIDGRQVLVYLPGWEGRYYWQYGEYRPEPLLGGEAGFARLCETAAAFGAHVMPMFGGNCANAWATNFHAFGPSSHMKTATRNVFHGNQPDWDLSRTHDTGWQAWLHPGAPAWQHELSTQVTTLADRFGFDSVFLDTVEIWINDPDFNMREGYRQLVDGLRAARPGLLVAGEDWWDGLLSIFPLFQRSGYLRQMPEWVGRYARLFGHICEGDPSRGSTGVFESGYASYAPMPDRAPYLATIAFVDGTLDAARAEVERVLSTLQAS
ncbi:hypothetical protein [Aggregatilinea lenta]|uniref:hypothetical protein n=1 Tax=Aggregatilinea lenta TaxID=913108 RepID=UPI000E5BEFDC|nr:hypothetical protein [Aggregatilinea lenta]